MNDPDIYRHEILRNGFTIIDPFFSVATISAIIDVIDGASTDRATFRKTADLFAIRQFLKEVPQLQRVIFTNDLTRLIGQVLGQPFFVVKSIYFDKPPASNWFVPWHQDLTISVKEKLAVEGFGPWTTKQNQYGVQPPVSILENNFTIRIHLDDTNEDNGALKVIPGSHNRGIVRPETIERKQAQQVSCNIKRGGMMFMKPLLLHASDKTTNGNRRRVIHIECSHQQLPAPLQWSECMPLQ